MIHHNPLREYVIRLRINNIPTQIVVGSNKMEPIVEFIKVKSIDDMITAIECPDFSILKQFGIETNSIRSRHLDIKNQFTGKITNSKTKLVFNESITFNCFKHPDGPIIKNKAIHYGFWSYEYNLLVFLVERQIFKHHKKISKTYLSLIGETDKCDTFLAFDMVRR